MASFLQKLFGEKKNSKDEAKERLKLVLIHDRASLSPGMVEDLRRDLIGVISKCDLMPENREVCERQLEKTGVRKPYFAVSVPGDRGVTELKRYLLELKERKGLT